MKTVGTAINEHEYQNILRGGIYGLLLGDAVGCSRIYLNKQGSIKYV